MTKMYVFCKSESTPEYWARMYHAYMSGSTYDQTQCKVKVPMYDSKESILSDILSVVFVKYKSDKLMLKKIFDLRNNLLLDPLYFVWEDKPDESSAGKSVLHLASRISELYFIGRCRDEEKRNKEAAYQERRRLHRISVSNTKAGKERPYQGRPSEQ